MSRLISFFVLVAIIVVIGLLFYKVMVGFFVPVFLAAVLVVVFRPLHKWVLEKTGRREQLSAVLTTALILTSVLLPTTLVVIAAAIQSASLINENTPTRVSSSIVKLRNAMKLEMEYADQIHNCDKENGGLDSNDANSRARLKQAVQALHTAVKKDHGAKFLEKEFENYFDITNKVGEFSPNANKPKSETETATDNEQTLQERLVALNAQYLDIRAKILGGEFLAALKTIANPEKKELERIAKQAFEYVQPQFLSLTGATGAFLVQFVIGTVILIISTFFFLYDGPGMVKSIMELSPLDDRYEQELLLEFDRISRAMVLATILSAITQGAFAGMGYYVAGLPNLMLLVILTTVFAMIPFVGPPVVWIPACIYLAFNQGQSGAAIGLALWGLLVVGTIDNVVKAYVLHGQAQLHPLLALLSVLGGVQALGPIGIVVGPMVVALLQTLLSILQREMLHFEDHTLVVAGPGGVESPKRPRFRLRRKKRTGSQTSQAKSESEPPQPAAVSPTAGET